MLLSALAAILHVADAGDLAAVVLDAPHLRAGDQRQPAARAGERIHGVERRCQRRAEGVARRAGDRERVGVGLDDLGHRERRRVQSGSLRRVPEDPGRLGRLGRLQRVGRAAPPGGFPGHAHELLELGIPGLEVVVADRPVAHGDAVQLIVGADQLVIAVRDRE
jgi:hypothetical protein